MLKQLHLKKEYGLVAASVLLLLLAYQFSFKKTIEAWHLRSHLKEQVQQSGDVSVQPGYLERKNRNLDAIINLYRADTVNFRSNILSTISSIAEQNSVKLAEVPSADPIFHTTQFTIQKLSFEGNYYALLKTLAALQGHSNIGRIRAVTFKLTGTRIGNDGARELVMAVYIETTNN